MRTLRERGDELLTSLRDPTAMRKRLRTTNAIERRNEEFRCGVKTLGSPPSSAAGLHHRQTRRAMTTLPERRTSMRFLRGDDNFTYVRVTAT